MALIKETADWIGQASPEIVEVSRGKRLQRILYRLWKVQVLNYPFVEKEGVELVKVGSALPLSATPVNVQAASYMYHDM